MAGVSVSDDASLHHLGSCFYLPSAWSGRAWLFYRVVSVELRSPCLRGHALLTNPSSQTLSCMLLYYWLSPASSQPCFNRDIDGPNVLIPFVSSRLGFARQLPAVSVLGMKEGCWKPSKALAWPISPDFGELGVHRRCWAHMWIPEHTAEHQFKFSIRTTHLVALGKELSLSEAHVLSSWASGED